MPNLWNLDQLTRSSAIAVPGETVPAMFWNGAAQRAGQVFMRQKELGLWREWTWAQTAQAVREVGDGLLSLGVQSGDCVSILSNTVVEWVLADLGVLSCGAVCNGIYPTDSSAQTQYLCEDSRTQILFVEDDEQLDKALEVRSRLPLLRKIVVFDAEGLREFSDPDVIDFAALRELGRSHAKTQPQQLDAITLGTIADKCNRRRFGIWIEHRREGRYCNQPIGHSAPQSSAAPIEQGGVNFLLARIEQGTDCPSEVLHTRGLRLKARHTDNRQTAIIGKPLNESETDAQSCERTGTDGYGNGGEIGKPATGFVEH